MQLALKCNTCRSVFRDPSVIEKILREKEEFEKRYPLEARKGAVGICPKSGCYGFLYQSV